MPLHYFVFQMSGRIPHQVVRLTRCINVPGHTAMLVRVMTETSYRWYPEYTVEEQYRDFNQSQYFCTVRIYPHIPELMIPSIGLMDSGLPSRWQYRMPLIR